MSNSFYHKEITDAQWNRIKFLFPQKKVGSPALDPRIVFNAILWMLASGARWRDLPTRYGNIYHKFRQWCESGLLLLLVNADGTHSALLEMDFHVLINERMQLLNVILPGENIQDSQPAIELFADVNLKGKKILADKAYSCQT